MARDSSESSERTAGVITELRLLKSGQKERPEFEMPPRSEYVPASTLKIVPPAHRSSLQTGPQWLRDKHDTDGAEGLWRIHDGLYDLTSFVETHPGGSEWLRLTKGTDITEAFEVHHVRTAHPDELVKKFYVRDAKTQRNSPFTFKDDGFYRILKREVRAILPTLPVQSANNSAFFTDSLLVGVFLFSILATTYWNYGLAIIAGFCLSNLSIASHNYFHQRDNYRMLYFNLSLMQTREWRISHALSHHLHTNTIDDMELCLIEPGVQFLPHNKPFWVKYGYFVMFPVYWATGFHASLVRRAFWILRGQTDLIQWYDWIPFTLPAAMYLFGGQPFLHTIWLWNVIVLFASFQFSAIGFNAAHHHPDIFHDGDTPRPEPDYDWGISQLDAVMDRTEITGSHFLVLTTFGDHALHHMFPTLDHGTLELIYPTFKKVATQFNVDLRMTSLLDLLKGTFKQVSRTEPNPNPPDLLKKYS